MFEKKTIQTSLYLFAHQDDEVGIFQKLINDLGNDIEVVCVYLTDGEFYGVSEEIRNKESLKVLLKLGVNKKNIIFAGKKLEISDGSLVYNSLSACEYIKKLILRYNASTVFVPAFEGGHHDHDALNIITRVAVMRSKKALNLYEFPLYRLSSGRYPFLKVFCFPRMEKNIIPVKITFYKKIKFFFLCFEYPSQWKTWIILLPVVFVKLLSRKGQYLKKIHIYTSTVKPNNGKLLYEFRKAFKWEVFLKEILNLEELT